MSERVPDGQYVGTTLARRESAGLILAETAYRPGVVVPAHVHGTPLVSSVLHGSMTEQHGRRAAICDAGSLIYQPPEEPHSHRFETGARCFIVQFGESWMSRMEEMEVLHPSAPLDLRRSRANWLLDQIHHEFTQQDRAADLAIEGFSIALLSELARARNRGDEGARPAWLMRVVELLHMTLVQDLTMGDIAAAVEIHPVHMAKTFRRFYGCTMGEYVRRLRVERAKEQLASTDRPLSSVAFEAGFADQAHFSRVFKKLAGVTPSAFRAAHAAK